MRISSLKILQDYLEKAGISEKKYSTILTDATGTIKSMAGLSFDIGLVRPRLGMNITEFHPVFEGLFPVDNEPVILPNIETLPGVFWDIHLLIAVEAVWIIFEEKSKLLEVTRPELQRHNEFQCKRETEQNNLGYHLISLLDYLVFAPRNNSWEIIGERPDWTQLFLKGDKRVYSYSELFEIFPYLESFFPEEFRLYLVDLASDIWTETIDNQEFHFRAQFISHQSEQYFLIKRLNAVLEVNQDVLQKVREKSLSHEQLQKSEQISQQLIRTKEQFLSIVSHDLRSPFISIISALDYLFEDPVFTDRLGEEHKEFLEYIHSDSKRLLDYLEKLLDWTRLDTGKLQPVKQLIKLADMWRLSYSQFEQRLADKEIRMHVNIANGFELNADPTLFSQVINNLIGNAIKFTPRQGEITLKASLEGGIPVIRIRDTGVGIPAEKINNLFKETEKYFTDGTEGEKGTGLGLSICKKILDVHGFNIRCNSDIGKGTEFVISL